MNAHRTISQTKLLRYVVFSLALLLGHAPSLLPAAVVEVPLANPCCNFAFNPQTGDVLAIDSEKGEVLLIRWTDVNAGKLNGAVTTKVGDAPLCAVYKRFGEQRIFAVCCRTGSVMYLLDANTGKVIQEVEIETGGVTQVASSANPDDPYLYYVYAIDEGFKLGSRTGVVNLRNGQNQGFAFAESYDCAISASGEVAYRLVRKTQTGVEALLRTNALTADKPTYMPLFCESRYALTFPPDHHDHMTACGDRICSRSFETGIAKLDFPAHCFFNTRPLIVGANDFDLSVWETSRTTPAAPFLRLFSANTFAALGDDIPLSRETRPVLVDRSSKVPSLSWRDRIFADDVRDQIVVGMANKICYVPLAELNLPVEPMLSARLEGPREIRVDEDVVFKLIPADAAVRVAFEKLPEGMVAEGNKLAWRPSIEQLGPVQVKVHLTKGEFAQTLSFDLQVKHPSKTLPFTSVEFAISADGAKVAIWEGEKLDAFGRPDYPRHEKPPTSFRFAIFDLEKQTVLAEKTYAEPPEKAAFVGDMIVIGPIGKTRRHELCKVADLESILELPALSIQQIQVFGDLLVTQNVKGINVYSTATNSLVKEFPAIRSFGRYEPPRQIAMVTGEGIFTQGVLLDGQLNPGLILSPGQLPTMPGADSRWRPKFLVAAEAAQYAVAAASLDQIRGQPAPAPAQTIRGGKISFTLDVRNDLHTAPEPRQPNVQKLDLALVATGELEARHPILRLYRRFDKGKHPRGIPRMHTYNDGAAVVFEDSLFKWSLSSDLATDSNLAATARLIPRQSALALSGAGKSVLKHFAKAGTPSGCRFNLITPYDAITIEPATGDVTIDESKLFDEAAATLAQWVARRAKTTSYLETLQAQTEFLSSEAEKVLGRKPRGVPVAIPIHVALVKGDQTHDALQYYVVTELPSAPLLKRMAALDAEREIAVKSATGSNPTGSGAPTGFTPGQSRSDLERRIESLEQRLELISRQLDSVLKRYEKRS